MRPKLSEAIAALLYWWMDLVREQFDKMVLVWLLVYFTTLVVFAHTDMESTHWLREITSGVLGALLGLITGIKIGQGMARVNTPASPSRPSDPPVADKTVMTLASEIPEPPPPAADK